MSPLAVMLGVARVPFLFLAVVCWVLGVSAAFWQGYVFPWWDAAIALMGAVAAHVAVNALNEYEDFRSGLDLTTERTAFSGGSGTLVVAPEGVGLALRLGWASLAVVLAVGGYFVWKHGSIMLWPGLVGLALVVSYTNLITRHALVCLLAPGIGFGPAMTGGVYLAMTGQLTLLGVLVSLLPLGLVSNLLLLNQLPDEEADRAIGRRHLVVARGRAGALPWLLPMWAVSALSLIYAVAAGYAPHECALGFVVLAVGMRVYGRVFTGIDNMQAIIREMGQNVKVTLAYPVVVAFGFVLARIH